METTPTASQISRQMLLGGGGRNKRREPRGVAAAREVDLPPDAPTAMVAVDLLWLDGQPLVDVPLLERKRLLDAVLVDHELVRRTVLVRPPVEAWYAQWRALGFREYAGKAAHSRYQPGGARDPRTTPPIPQRESFGARWCGAAGAPRSGRSSRSRPRSRSRRSSSWTPPSGASRPSGSSSWPARS